MLKYLCGEHTALGLASYLAKCLQEPLQEPQLPPSSGSTCCLVGSFSRSASCATKQLSAFPQVTQIYPVLSSSILMAGKQRGIVNLLFRLWVLAMGDVWSPLQILCLHSGLAERGQPGKVLNLCSPLQAPQEAPLACLMPHMLAELCTHWHCHVRPLTPFGSCWCQSCEHRAHPYIPSPFCRACQGPLCRLQCQSSSLGFPARAGWEDMFPFRHCCVAIPGAGGTLMSEDLFKLLQEEHAYEVTSRPLVLEEYCLHHLWFYAALSDPAAARRLALPQHHHGLAGHQETAFGLTAQWLAETCPKGPWLGLTGFSGGVMGLTWPGQWIKEVTE